MACLSQMELPGNSSRNQIFFDTVSFYESEPVPTGFFLSPQSIWV